MLDVADRAAEPAAGSPASSSNGLTWLVAGGVAAGLVVLVLVLLLGGGAPQPAPPGLPDTGPVVGWALDLVPYLTRLLGVATVGFTLLGTRLLDGSTQPERSVRLLALAWAGTTLLTAALTVVQLRVLSAGGPAPDLAADLATSLSLRAALAQTLAAALVALLTGRVPTAALAMALFGLLPPVLTGHVRTDGAPWLAGVSLAVHVLAASLWVGGLLALGRLALRDRLRWSVALWRYSRLALLCVVALTVSGIVVALQRVREPADLVTSAYGAVVLIKAAGLLLLAGLGARQRRLVLGRLRRRPLRSFLLLAATELVLMGLVLALAVGLARTPPPSTAGAGLPGSDVPAATGSVGDAATDAAPAVPLTDALVRAGDLPAGYRSGAGHQHAEAPGAAPPTNPPTCTPIEVLIGTHPGVLQTQHPQVSASFTKSHFGPLVTETVIDYGNPAGARQVLDRLATAANRCDRYEQSSSSIGAQHYDVRPGPLVAGVDRGTTLRLEARGAEFTGITWDLWAERVGSRLVAVSFRSAKGGDNDDWAPAVSAALERLGAAR